MVNAKRKRRWCQFSLRTLLVAMFVSCATFGFWVQFMRQQARENRERVAADKDAVAAIEELGGEVVSEYQELRSQTWLEKEFEDPGDADDPVGVLKVTAALLCTELNATTAEHLKRLTHLEFLVLIGPQITNASLEHLKELTHLQYLSLSGTRISDAGLEHLKALTQLERLRLLATNVTDAGVEKLQQALPNCEIWR